MAKNSLQYQEAENGLEALLAYQRSSHQFSAILMGNHASFPSQNDVHTSELDFHLHQYQKIADSQQTCRCPF